jgi:hypothetical protein
MLAMQQYRCQIKVVKLRAAFSGPHDSVSIATAEVPCQGAENNTMEDRAIGLYSCLIDLRVMRLVRLGVPLSMSIAASSSTMTFRRCHQNLDERLTNFCV